jgi:hypothetical protein
MPSLMNAHQVMVPKRHSRLHKYYRVTEALEMLLPSD